ncbi:glycosyltransferase [Butyrivibrio sp. MC2013]|uniref:glycosyltransferase n=1 Tax=Butyrivibrio sp. MC2013 TaxID=1280686 RepID=UPI0003F60C0F|nr:glycosyltransferase [Butyrivibrio sp. MC2013]
MVNEHRNTELSIIVPVYNVEKYLDECVRSLLDQDYDSYEIVLVDDGSTDSSGEICDRYAKDHDIVSVVHKKNGGLGSARNTGMKACNGKYILFVDSDDYLSRDCLSKLMNRAVDQQLDILAFGAHSFADKGGEVLYQYTREKIPFYQTMTGEEALKIELKNKEYMPSVCIRLFSRVFLNGIDLVFNEIHIHEDEDFTFLAYLRASRVQTIPDEYYQRRFRSNSIITSENYKKSYDSYSYVASRLLDESEKLDKSKKNLCLYYHDVLVLSIINRYCMLPKSDRRKNRNLIRAFISEKKTATIPQKASLKIAYRSLSLYNILLHVRSLLFR